VIRLRSHQIEKADLAEQLKIDRHRLEKELERQPGLYAWWASLLAQVDSKVRELKDKKGEMEARMARDLRKQGYRPTEIKSRFYKDEDYIKLLARIRNWEESADILKYAEKAFSQRKDALMSLNATVRKEKENSRE